MDPTSILPEKHLGPNLTKYKGLRDPTSKRRFKRP